MRCYACRSSRRARHCFATPTTPAFLAHQHTFCICQDEGPFLAVWQHRFLLSKRNNRAAAPRSSRAIPPPPCSPTAALTRKQSLRTVVGVFLWWDYCPQLLWWGFRSPASWRARSRVRSSYRLAFFCCALRRSLRAARSCGGGGGALQQRGAGQLRRLRPGLPDPLLRHGRRPLARRAAQVQRGRDGQLGRGRLHHGLHHDRALGHTAGAPGLLPACPLSRATASPAVLCFIVPVPAVLLNSSFLHDDAREISTVARKQVSGWVRKSQARGE